MQYENVVAAGTFDRFHKGHELFLETAFKSGKKVFIGLTTPEMLHKKTKQNSIWKYEKRKKVVEGFVKKFKKECIVSPIEDPFKPATEMKDFDAIVATEETKENCEKINRIRENKGLKPLKIILAPYAYADDGRVISSSRIRNGEIDREGRVLVDYCLTEDLRKEFEEPVNPIFKGDNKPMTKVLVSYIKNKGVKTIICVGDEVSYDLLKSGFKPKNVIIDGKIKKNESSYKDFILKNYPNKFTVDNPPGAISKNVWGVVKEALGTKSVIFINGEEDLLTYPAVLLAENNSVVIYGQPDQGKVVVRVDEDKKEKLRKKLGEFKTVRS